MVSLSVCLGVEPRSGLMISYFLLFESYCHVHVGRSLWQKDWSVVYISWYETGVFFEFVFGCKESSPPWERGYNARKAASKIMRLYVYNSLQQLISYEMTNSSETEFSYGRAVW
jgi:hypothetical protein